jgi:CHRD domain
MNSKLMIPLALAVAGLAACGSSGGGSGSHPASHGPGRPVRSYHVTLSGKAVVSATKTVKAAGAPRGAGAAAIALHHHALVCFRFAHLRGFTNPTTAQIAQAPKGKAGKAVLELSRTHALRRRGCARASRALAAALEKTPSNYYVLVNSKQYPHGAIRGQL